MKILVISDTHRNTAMLRKALDNHPEIEHIFHLGDLNSDVEQVKAGYPNKKFYCVCGNNDFISEYAETGIQVLNGRTIYYTHGHLQRVHSNFSALVAEAKQYKADIALFGHTHVALVEEFDGVYIFNPGSASKPRQGEKGYGIIELGEELFFEFKTL